MTVAEQLSLLGSLLTDLNEEVYTTTDYKLPALNSSQRDLVGILLGFQHQYEGVIDLLSEIQEVETPSVSVGGYDLTGLSSRYMLRNGYVNASIIDDDGYERFCERIAVRKLGLTENRYYEGTTRDPKIRIFGNTLYLMVSVGSLPRTVTLYYIGQPYKLATTAVSSGKDSEVATCELNPLLHDLVVMMAEVKLRRARGGNDNFQQAQLVDTFVKQQIQLLVTGAQGEPQVNTFGQFARQQTEFLKKRMEKTS